MTEQVGKITLDYTYYPGEDFYCDGVIEQEILEIAKKYKATVLKKIFNGHMYDIVRRTPKILKRRTIKIFKAIQYRVKVYIKVFC